MKLRSAKKLMFVRNLPCLICENDMGIQAHHLRKKRDNYPKAMGSKVSDEFTVPFCFSCHNRLHTPNSSEDRFWEAEYYGDPYQRAEQIHKDWIENVNNI